MDYYAGIGSRQTPAEILEIMTEIAIILSSNWTLRSGGAEGADSAFEAGAEKKQIFLPWRGFNKNPSLFCSPSPDALRIASKVHPAWDRCSRGARLLHARNTHQILGPNIGVDTPCKVVICWHNGSGGTMQAVRIANLNKIPVWNLKEFDTKVFESFSEEECAALIKLF